ncbi:MAG: hypothetical protein LBH39_06030, partial [Clostridiales Family XIII bacterium]|nr:hypothetical protein [Clostridiales Family XIII bacterium]
IDGQSLIGIICGRLGVHNPAALSWSVLIVTVPGMILGLSHTKDWGAKVGALICWGAAASVLFPLILYA